MPAARPFPIDDAVARIAAAVAHLPRAALFELADDGYTSPFEQLVACVLSIRTRDEVMLPTARRLLERARTPAAIAALDRETLHELVRPSTFHAQKAATIAGIARRVVEEHDGTLPCDFQVLTGFSGVGPKCANLVLGIACGEARIGVDVHVHRITNRWGYVAAPDPEATMRALEAVLPERYRVEINRILVPFGKHVCTGRAPHCSTCPVRDVCRQVGVTSHR